MHNSPEIWIYSPNFPETLSWYVEVLGFESRILDPQSAAILTFHGQEINLGQVWEPWPEDKFGKLELPLGRGCQFYFDCPNWGKLKDRLHSNNVRLPRQPWQSLTDDTVTDFLDVIDPNGYWLTFRQVRAKFEVQ